MPLQRQSYSGVNAAMCRFVLPTKEKEKEQWNRNQI
jgi:hypothetical protein